MPDTSPPNYSFSWASEIGSFPLNESLESLVPPPYSCNPPEDGLEVQLSSREGPSSLQYPGVNVEDDLIVETLRRFKVVILVDDSISMRGGLWLEAKHALAEIVETASKFDTEGIDVDFLNRKEVGRNLKSSDQVFSLFEDIVPWNSTPLGASLDQLLREYLDEIEAAKFNDNKRTLQKMKPVNYIVITDGMPTVDYISADIELEYDVEYVIVKAAKRLDIGNFPLNQLRIQLVQIGQSVEVSQFLRKLDDILSEKYNIRDIVDTTPYDDVGTLTDGALIKIILGGINRRIDNQV